MKYKFYIGLLFLHVFILSCTSGKDSITKFISVDIQNIKEEVELPISLTDLTRELTRASTTHYISQMDLR